MAIVLNPGQRDPFGGPAGSTQNAMQMVLQGIMQGAEKRKANKQNQLLSSMFSEQTGEQGPPRSSDMFIDSLFANPELTPQSKATGMQYMAAKSDIDLSRAQAEKARAGEPEKRRELRVWGPDGKSKTMLVPDSKYNEVVDHYNNLDGYTTEEVKKKEVEWWNADGTPGGKKLVPEAEYNDFVDSLIKAQKVVQKPDEDDNEPEYTPKEALDERSKILKAMATFGQTNEITAAIVAANPELGDMLGKKVDDETKETLMQSWRDQLDYLDPYLPERYKRSTEKTKAKAEAEAETANTIKEGQTATNQKTGQKIIFRNGKWSDAKTGKEL